MITCRLPSIHAVCRARIDLGFLVDGSSGTGRAAFSRVLQYIAATMSKFEVSIVKTRIGVLVYSTGARVALSFRSSAHSSTVSRALNRVRFVGGQRNTGRALLYAKNFLFSGKPRCGRRRVAVLLTTGRSRDQVRRAAISLQAAGTEIYVVGIGAVSRTNLMRIATDRSHVLVVNAPALLATAGTLKDRICRHTREYIKAQAVKLPPELWHSRPTTIPGPFLRSPILPNP